MLNSLHNSYLQTRSSHACQLCSKKLFTKLKSGKGLSIRCRSKNSLIVSQASMQVEDIIHRITTCGKIVGEVHEEDGNQGFMIGHYDMLTKKEPYLYYWVDTKGLIEDDVIGELRNESCIQISGDIVSPTCILANEIRIMTNPSNELIQVPSPIQKSIQIQRPIQKMSYQDSLPVGVIEREVPNEGAALWEHLFSHPGDYWDMRSENAEGSKQPSFRHKTLQRKLFVDERTPADIRAKLAQGGDMPASYPGWDLLFSKPAAFWRFPNKSSPKQPDFLHKPTQCGIWFEKNNSNQQQRDFMEFLDAATLSSDPGTLDDLPQDPWQDVVKNPQNWEDLRNNKTNPRSPDFRDATYRNGLALWLSDATPQVQQQLRQETSGLKFAKSKLQIITESWQDVVDHPENWKDFRAQKEAGKVKANYPDFKSLDNQVALWVDSTSTPIWVLEHLSA